MAEKTEEKKKTEKKAPVKEVASESTVTKKTDVKDVKKSETKKTNGFAVIATGGKQYVVHEGDYINVEKLADTPKKGAKMEFAEVLLTDNGTVTKVGTPTVSGAKVVAEFVKDGRDKKISVIRFRSKSRYFKNRGHRQPYTRVKITKV